MVFEYFYYYKGILHHNQKFKNTVISTIRYFNSWFGRFLFDFIKMRALAFRSTKYVQYILFTKWNLHSTNIQYIFNNTAISKNIYFVVNSILPELLKTYYLSHKVCQNTFWDREHVKVQVHSSLILSIEVIWNVGVNKSEWKLIITTKITNVEWNIEIAEEKYIDMQRPKLTQRQRV